MARAQRLGKFRTVDISGVAAITCRHVYFAFRGVIDLISGERYVIFNESLQRPDTCYRHAFIDILIAFFLWRVARKLLEIGIHYDVICIYIRHLLERM